MTFFPASAFRTNSVLSKRDEYKKTYIMSLLNKTVSCGTTPIKLRSDCCFTYNVKRVHYTHERFNQFFFFGQKMTTEVTIKCNI